MYDDAEVFAWRFKSSGQSSLLPDIRSTEHDPQTVLGISGWESAAGNFGAIQQYPFNILYRTGHPPVFDGSSGE
jgi:hypothetical protein